MRRLIHQWTCESFPISAASYHAGQLHIRLSGADAAVQSYSTKLPSAATEISSDFWQQLNEQTLPFFTGDTPLYRMIVPATAALSDFDAGSYIDWGGALRWLKTEMPFADVQAYASSIGGSASCYRHGNRDDDVFAALPPESFALHQRIKQVMDPANILNPGRLYRDL
jgi:glycolate oxidase FAD binding subunit